MEDSVQRCGRCKTTQPSGEFAAKQRGRDGFWCRTCRREVYRERHPAPEPVPNGHSRCGHCKTVKPLSDFYVVKTGPLAGKVQNNCKACYAQRHLDRYQLKSDGTDQPRDCVVCGKTYQPKQRRKSIYCSTDCGQVARKESGREREAYLQRTYGIGIADYDRMLANQGGGCALCGVSPEKLTAGRFRTYLHVDHNGETGEVRGLLCPNHNLMIGQWFHDPALLRRAADYLEGLLI